MFKSKKFFLLIFFLFVMNDGLPFTDNAEEGLLKSVQEKMAREDYEGALNDLNLATAMDPALSPEKQLQSLFWLAEGNADEWVTNNCSNSWMSHFFPLKEEKEQKKEQEKEKKKDS